MKVHKKMAESLVTLRGVSAGTVFEIPELAQDSLAPYMALSTIGFPGDLIADENRDAAQISVRTGYRAVASLSMGQLLVISNQTQIVVCEHAEITY